MDSIAFEILNFSYWEHFKKAKDLSMIYPPDHPERVLLQQVMDEMILKINQYQKELQV